MTKCMESWCLKLTFKVGSNFPANASKRVVFPDEGGPNNKVILQQDTKKFHKILFPKNRMKYFRINYIGV